jgi:hypothetical protein
MLVASCIIVATSPSDVGVQDACVRTGRVIKWQETGHSKGARGVADPVSTATRGNKTQMMIVSMLMLDRFGERRPALVEYSS